MIGVDIFSGAGGMSLGAIMAGINVRIAIESDKHAADTFKANHPETDVKCKDIRSVSLVNYFEETNEDVFVVFGGPPCQGFSVSNTKTRNLDNNNNKLFKEFIRIIEEVQPKWFVFENVEGFQSFNRGMVVKTLKEEFEMLGYNCSYDVLTASNYGVPQNRNRFFMVGNRLGINYSFPEQQPTVVNVHQAICDLPPLKNGDCFDELPYRRKRPSNYARQLRNNSTYAKQNLVSRNQDYVIERYSYIGQGENWKSVPKSLMSNYSNSDNCHSGIYKRLDAKKPSVVIANYRKNMLIHPYEHRGLSVREAARIQSFPDSFIFKGSLMHIQQQIGNAVPPLLAKAIFQQIINLTPENGQG